MRTLAHVFTVGSLAQAVALAAPGMLSIVSGGPDRPVQKLKVVVFGGHPDDPESGAGGLVVQLTPGSKRPEVGEWHSWSIRESCRGNACRPVGRLRR